MSEKVIATKEDTTVKVDTSKKVEETEKTVKSEKAETIKKSTATRKPRAQAKSGSDKTEKPVEKKTSTRKKESPEKEVDTVQEDITIKEVPSVAKPEEIEQVTGEPIDSIFKLDDIERYHEICNNIQTELCKVETSYLTIACDFYAIRHKKLFQIDNYANAYDMALEKYGLSRGTCNNYINICEKFGAIDESTGECTGLKPEYTDYSSSQLVQMLQVPKEHLKDFSPDMSVREMKRQKEIYKEKGVPLEAPNEPKSNSAKTKKLELMKSKDITEVLKTDNPLLAEKLSIFESEHPDTDFDISITLVYKE